MLNAIRGSAIRRLPSLAGGLSLFLASVSAAYASAGCDTVNGGFWNITPLGLGGTSINDFEEGDQITFNFSTSSGTASVRVRNPFNTAATYSVSVTLSVEQYTVTAADMASAIPGTLVLFNDGPSQVNVTATCVAAGSGGGGSSVDRSEAVTKGFLQSRINGILLNNPGATSLVNRSQATGPQQYASSSTGTMNVASNGAAASGSVMGLGAHFGDATGRGASRFDDADEGSLGSRNIQFRNSLSQMRRQARAARMEEDRMALGAGDGGSLPVVYEVYSPWDVWVEGRFSRFDDDAGSLDRDGHVGVLYFGGDYRITPDMILGGLVQFDWAKDDSGVLASKVDGTGWMIGPYLSARVHENIYFDLRASWGRSSNDIDVAGASGSFDTARWLVRGALSGNWQYDAWRIMPSAELAYVKERADGYTNSAATFVPGQEVALGRLQFGPEIGYRFVHTSDSFLEPFGAVRGVWDFDNPNVAIINGYVVGPGDFWGRLEGGLNWVTTSGLYVRGSATWDGMGAGDYNGYTLQGTVNVPLN